MRRPTDAELDAFERELRALEAEVAAADARLPGPVVLDTSTPEARHALDLLDLYNAALAHPTREAKLSALARLRARLDLARDRSAAAHAMRLAIGAALGDTPRA